MGGPQLPSGGRLLQRLRPWRVIIEGVTDGNEGVVNRINVNGLTGMEFRTVMREVADGKMPFQPGDGGPAPGGGGTGPVTAPGSGPDSGATGPAPAPGASIPPAE